MPANLVSTACLGNLNDPSYELLLRRELGGVFETDGCRSIGIRLMPAHLWA